MSKILSKEQIENWRRVLFTMVGSYALIMPEEDVQRMRDEMQSRFGEDDAPQAQQPGGVL